jgi:hypothetical protein
MLRSARPMKLPATIAKTHQHKNKGGGFADGIEQLG